MTDREKLIELLVKDPCYFEFGSCGKCWYHAEPACYPPRMADHLLANGVTFAKDTDVQSKWISVEDELPHAECGESDNVLAVDGHGIVEMLYFDGGCWCYPTGEPVFYEDPSWRITHWMPMPEPPVGSSTDGAERSLDTPPALCATSPIVGEASLGADDE